MNLFFGHSPLHIVLTSHSMQYFGRVTFFALPNAFCFSSVEKVSQRMVSDVTKKVFTINIMVAGIKISVMLNNRYPTTVYFENA